MAMTKWKKKKTTTRKDEKDDGNHYYDFNELFSIFLNSGFNWTEEVDLSGGKTINRAIKYHFRVETTSKVCYSTLNFYANENTYSIVFQE